MRGRARALAARTLRENAGVFERLGFAEAGERGSLSPVLERDRTRLRLGMVGEGRVFGGGYSLEVATDGPVLPESGGISARPRGVVRLARVAFVARRGDETGARLAAQLETNTPLQETLARLHFDRVRVDPDGRPVVRHVGGSVVWTAFPPLVRAVPLVPEQAEAIAEALDAFAAAGR
jgi:uncharacterized protein DUF3156